MNHNPKLSISLLSIERLSNAHYYRRLWLAAVNQRISRREWLNEIAEALYFYPGTLRAPDGRPIPVPEVDKVFDSENRWMSYYLESDPSTSEPRRYCLRSPARLQLIDAYFQIKHPQIWRHFGR